MGFQVELTLYDLAAQPEILRLMSDSARFSESTVSLAADVHALPDRINDVVEAQRRAIAAELDAREAVARDVLAELNTTIDAADRLVQSIDTVAARFDAREMPPDYEPLDMADVRDAAIEAGVAADEFTDLLEVAQGLLASPSWQERSTEITNAWGRVEQGGRGWISLGFRQTLMVIGAAFLALVAYRWVAVKLIKA